MRRRPRLACPVVALTCILALAGVARCGGDGTRLPFEGGDATRLPRAGGDGNALLPLVLSTWPWTAAAEAGAAALAASAAAGASPRAARLDAVVAAATSCERSHCGGPGHGAPGTVGPGGSPDERGGTSLDAVVMDGPSAAAGAVGCLTASPSAAATARAVLERTAHTLLVGPGADAFAAAAGLPAHANLSTPASVAAWAAWRARGCQPNFWRALPGLRPDPRAACGPYVGGVGEGGASSQQHEPPARISAASHDTLAVVVVDAGGASAAGASSNGAAHKIPGRVGDAAVPGGGAYASAAGGCGATGDGDAHLRFLPCAHAMALVEGGAGPAAAAEAAVARMAAAVPGYTGALVVADGGGRVGAAAAGWGAPGFAYALVRGGGRAQVVGVPNLRRRDGGGGVKSE